MEMNEAQRRDLAARIESKRLSDYGGNRRRAYTAAGVNAATWTKAEDAQPIAERSYVAIIRALWPETYGDWRRMSPPLGDDPVAELTDKELETLRQIIGAAEVDEALRRRLLERIELRERGA